MTEKDEINTLNEEAEERTGEWSRDDAIVMSFMEAQEQAEAEFEEQELKDLREIIEKFHLK